MKADELLHKYFDVLAVEQLSPETCVLLNQFKAKVFSTTPDDAKAIRSSLKQQEDCRELMLLWIQFYFEAKQEGVYEEVPNYLLIKDLIFIIYDKFRPLAIHGYNPLEVTEKIALLALNSFKPIIYKETVMFDILILMLFVLRGKKILSNNVINVLEEFTGKLVVMEDSDNKEAIKIKNSLNVLVMQRNILNKYFGDDEKYKVLPLYIYQLLNNFKNEIDSFGYADLRFYSHLENFVHLATVKELFSLLDEDNFQKITLLWTELFFEQKNINRSEQLLVNISINKSVIPNAHVLINTLLLAFYKHEKALNDSLLVNILNKFEIDQHSYYWDKIFNAVLELIEKFKNKQDFSPELLAKVIELYNKYIALQAPSNAYYLKEYLDVKNRLKRLAAISQEQAIVLPFDDQIGQRFEFYQLNQAQLHSANWPTLISADIDKMPVNQQQAWAKLWTYAATADGGSPSKKWLTQGQVLIQNTQDFATIATKCLECILDDIKENDVDLSNAFSEANKQAVKGFIWLCSCANSDIFASVLGGLANFGYSKAYGVGARAPAVANAALYTLGQIGAQGVVQLSKLRSKVKFKNGLKLIEKALTEAAARQGISQDDLEELSVPKIGFNQDYIKKVDWGIEYTANIILIGSKKVDIVWYKNEQVLKNTPSSIKTDYRSQFKELQKQLTDIQDIITGQTKRFEDSYLAKRQWQFIDWQQRLLNHDLLSWLATRLIWVFEHNGHTQHGFYLSGQLVNAQNQAITVNEQSIVSLWHPVYSTVEEVQQWRALISQQQIIQPFKQAYREVYLITPAEIETANYSNRFTGHVLKQHHFAALAKERGWGYKLQGDFDGFNSPNKYIPAWNMGVTLNLDYSKENQLTTETGLYQYIHTTKVTFWQDRFAVDLINVPAIIFSEMMRDIDLFVGVTSVGTEATTDLYANNPYTDYIDAFSKAELSARAVVRQEVLANIISKLAIAPRCSFDNKHLIVKGDLRTYKIHLGSSNILMEPNDQYLCIVPSSKQKQASTDGLYLPFEGDLMLSVILSKALLLAADKKIKDQSILAQINRV